MKVYKIKPTTTEAIEVNSITGSQRCKYITFFNSSSNKYAYIGDKNGQVFLLPNINNTNYGMLCNTKVRLNLSSTDGLYIKAQSDINNNIVILLED